MDGNFELAASNRLLFLLTTGNVVLVAAAVARIDVLLLAALLYGQAGAVVLDDNQLRKWLIEFLLKTSSSADPFVDVRKSSDKFTKSLIV